MLHHWDGPAPTGDTQGGQANGHSGRGRPSLTASQVRLLHEGHRQDVPLSFTRENHSVPGAFQQIHSQNFPVFYDNYQTPLVKVWPRLKTGSSKRFQSPMCEFQVVAKESRLETHK